MSSAQVPKLEWPWRLSGRQFAVIEQDSTEEIEQCVETICRYQPGDLDLFPEFGIGPYEFEEITQISPDDLRQEVARFEPRAALNIGSELQVDPSQVLLRVATERRTNG